MARVPGGERFRDAFDRHLRRRRLALGLHGARRGGARAFLAAAALLLLVALGVLPRPGGPVAMVLLYAGLLAFGTALGAALPLLRAGGLGEAARALDRALGGEDLVATAVALAARPAAAGRFGAAVLERAGEEVAALPPERVGPVPRPPWGLLLLALAVAFILPLIPEGGFGLLPGLGGGRGSGGRPRSGEGKTGDGPGAAQLAAPGTRETPATPDAPPSPRPPDAPSPSASPPPVEPPPAPRDPVARLSLAPLARSYPSDGPVALGVVADGLAGAGKGADLDLAISVDDAPAVPEKRPIRIEAGSHETRGIDLRSWPGLSERLGPGKHRVKGILRDGMGKAQAESPEVVVEIEPGGDDKRPNKGGAPPSPSRSPGSPPPPPEPSASQPPPAPGKSPGEEPPALPPSRFDRKFVNPLFGEGAEVNKRGPLLVLDPEGSRGAEHRAMPPEEALREVKARAEAAARREGVDPRDLEAVRRYFEALRRILEEK